MGDECYNRTGALSAPAVTADLSTPVSTTGWGVPPSPFLSEYGSSGGGSGYGGGGGGGSSGWPGSGSSVTVHGDSVFSDCGTDSKGNTKSLGYVNGQFLFMRSAPDGSCDVYTSDHVGVFGDSGHGHHSYDASGNSTFRDKRYLGGRPKAGDE